MVLSFVFSLQWPLTQSTTVLMSPLISNTSFLPSVCISRIRGARTPGFFVGTLPPFSVLFPVACLVDASGLNVTSSLRGGPCAMSCVQSFPSPAHFDIGVSHCILLLWNPNSWFQRVTLLWSVDIPNALLLWHHVVVLHPRIDRSAFTMGMSPS